MSSYGRRRSSAFRQGRSGHMRSIAVLAAVCIAFRLLYAAGADSAFEAFMKNLAESEGFTKSVLDFELGGVQREQGIFDRLGVWGAVLFEIPGLERGAAVSGQAAVPTEAGPPPQEPMASGGADAAVSPEIGEISPQLYNPAGDAPADGEGEEAGDVVQCFKEQYVTMKNNTSFDINVSELLNEELNFALDTSKPQVLILHTHGSEAYTADGGDAYPTSDPYRTEDDRYSVIRVGDELAAALEAKGIVVLHDRSLYDYPSYTGSYNRSLAAVEAYLKEYPDIKIVIDLHRDAIEDAQGNEKKTVCEINGAQSAQILLVMCTGEEGLEFPNWRENLKLAVRLQAVMNWRYAGLARPLSVSTQRFNQHLTTGSMLVEVGMSGNTLQEALTAARAFADCAAELFCSLDPDLHAAAG